MARPAQDSRAQPAAGVPRGAQPHAFKPEHAAGAEAPRAPGREEALPVVRVALSVPPPPGSRMLFSSSGTLVAQAGANELLVRDLGAKREAWRLSCPGAQLLAVQRGGRKAFAVDGAGALLELCPDTMSVFMLGLPTQQGVQALAAAAGPGGAELLALYHGDFLSLALGVDGEWSYIPHVQQVRGFMALAVTPDASPYAYVFPGLDLAFLVLVAAADSSLHMLGASLLGPSSSEPRRSLVVNQQRVMIPSHPGGRPLSAGFFAFLDPGFVYCVDGYALLNLDGQNSTSIQFPLPEAAGAEANRVVAAAVMRKGAQNPTDLLVTAHADGIVRAIDLGAGRMTVVAQGAQGALGIVCSQTVIHLYTAGGEVPIRLQTVRSRLLVRAAPQDLPPSR